MATDVEAVYTTNNATIFHVVTDPVVDLVDLSGISDVCFCMQRRQEHRHVKGSVVQTWTQPQLINFPVANDSSLGYP